MRRILVLADSQIGVPTVSLDDQRHVLEQAVTLATTTPVDLVLHAGDVFEGPVVTPEQMRMFIDATAPLRRESIPLVITRGNGRHDAAVRDVHALDVLRELDHTVVSDHPEIFAAAGVGICTLPWVHPGRLLATMNGNVDHDSANEEIARLLVRIARDYAKVMRTEMPAMPLVLLAHWAVTGSKLPTGLAVEEMREPVLPWAELDALGFDAIIAGHVHYQQRLDDPAIDMTVGIVPGSPQPLNFGEQDFEHGVWLLELERGNWERIEFHPLWSRKFITFDDLYLASEDVDGAIVRVRYEATEEEARRIDHAEIRRTLLDAGAVRVQIEPTIIRAERARVEIADELSPADALDAYAESQGIDGPLRRRMLETFEEWSSQ